jgi:hypothetical protein
MNLGRLSHDPNALVDFYQQAIEHLGGVCERTWYDRLQFVVEGRAALPWKEDGGFHEGELHFPAPDTIAPRDAEREVFPGCPLTFRLAEMLPSRPLTLERAVMADEHAHPPLTEVAEKIWRNQWPEVARWRLESAFTASFHISLLVLARCEIQAIDQHWSLHRLALSVPGGEPDHALAEQFEFIEATPEEPPDLRWPDINPADWKERFSESLMTVLGPELEPIRRRQENYLGRELARIDKYFAGYERELTARGSRSQSENNRSKSAERVAAARMEHERRRADQVQRHEIRVLPRLDALLLLAERAWKATVELTLHRECRRISACFVPRARRWFVE